MLVALRGKYSVGKSGHSICDHLLRTHVWPTTISLETAEACFFMLMQGLCAVQVRAAVRLSQRTQSLSRGRCFALPSDEKCFTVLRSPFFASGVLGG